MADILLQGGLDGLAAPGILGILALQLGAITQSLIKSRRNGKVIPDPTTVCWGRENSETLKGLAHDSAASLKILEVTGSDQRPMVYREHGTVRAIDSLQKSIDAQNIVLQKMCNKLDLLGK